ncbi:DUF4244 domain-containing protein [Streptomyces nitrosporeus]|nr:DUF4244 domain-containing protein [Streptomyces nitrosporeus]
MTPDHNTMKRYTGRQGNEVEKRKNAVTRALVSARRSWDVRVGRLLARNWREQGMTTSEYAVGTIAACAFAAVLYKVVTSGAVQSALQSLIKEALDAKF